MALLESGGCVTDGLAPTCSTGDLNDCATNVSDPFRRDSRSSLQSPATPNKAKPNSKNPSPTRKCVPRPHSAGPSHEYSSVRTSSLLSTVSSTMPLSHRVEAETGTVTPDTTTAISITRLKSARRTFEGGAISEERFLKMQAECYRLKRDLAEKEEQHKALVTRLNRAEGAVKRKLRASVENVSRLPKEKLSALAVLTQNYNAEKKLEELEDRLRVCRRDNLKYLQLARRCKAETEWLKGRLDATARASRGPRSCTCDISLKGYEKMVKDLRKQLSSLRKRNDCTSCCATNGTAVDQNGSKLSVEDQHGSPEITSSQDYSGSHFRGCASDHTYRGDIVAPNVVKEHLEGAEGDGTSLGRQSDTVCPVSSTATGSAFKETPVEQTIGDTLSTFDVTAQVIGTWERLQFLTVKHNKAMDELRLLKVNHETSAQNLQDAHRKLKQERANCLKLEAAEKRLSAEVMAAKHLEPLLQQVRQQNVQLEIENAELVASALNVPRTNFSELKVLRQQWVDELKQRKTAEAKVSNLSTQLEECKQDSARLAVVEANWEFLKSELAVAKAASSKADKKIKELQDSNQRLRKLMNMKGKDFLLMDPDCTNVSPPHGASCEGEEKKDSHEDDRTEEPAYEPDFDIAGEDNMPMMQEGKSDKYRNSLSGLLALRHENEDDISDVNVRNSHNSAVKLCSSALPRLCPNHIIMTILRLELNACTDLSSIRRICVCFQFLTDYCERDDQCTPLVSNNRAVLNFSFSSAFCVNRTLRRDVCESLKNVLESEATAHVRFQVLGEENEGRPEILLGFCQVDLWAAMYQDNRADLLETKLEVLSESSPASGIGYLHIVIHGLELLRDIHSLAMTSSAVTPRVSVRECGYPLGS